MAQPNDINLAVQRNEDYGIKTFQCLDLEKAPIDITGWSFAFRINTAAGLGGSPLLALSSTPTAHGSYVKIATGLAANGDIELFIDEDDVAALPGRSADTESLVYNLVATDAYSEIRVIARGAFTVEPGV